MRSKTFLSLLAATGVAALTGAAIGAEDTDGRGLARTAETTNPVSWHAPEVPYLAELDEFPRWSSAAASSSLVPEMKTLGAFLLEPTIRQGYFSPVVQR